MKKLLHLVLVLVCGLFIIGVKNTDLGSALCGSSGRIIEAFENRESGLQVQGEGTVSKILSDDLKGSRHQRFILTLEGGHTLLVAHNIDLAPRINSLKIGDLIQFYGVYEWNNKGGVIHWTHDDPKGRHVDGWLKKGGSKYQ